MQNIKYYIPGSVLILVAIIVVAVPKILVAFVAASIIMVGIGALYVGHMIRKSEIEFRDIDEWFSDDDRYGWRFVRRPVFPRWYRDF
jgi:hypothetical protein